MNLGISLKKFIDHKATRSVVLAATLSTIAFPVGWKIKLSYIRENMQDDCSRDVERRELLLNAIIEKDARNDPFKTLLQIKGLIYALEIKASQARNDLNSGEYPKPSVVDSTKLQLRNFPEQTGDFVRDWFANAAFTFEFLPSIRTDYGFNASQRYLHEDEQYRAEKLLTKLKESEIRLLYLLTNEQLEKLKTIHLLEPNRDNLYGVRIAEQPYYGRQWEKNALLYLNNKRISWID